MPRSQSSQSSQNQSVDDIRFAELLKPIKDLTVNWSVPLAKYLEDYYEELHELQISLDGHEAKVNFAEAALFLQGTASVYSKKVEFLWQNVLQMLDLLASKKALEEAENEEDGEGGQKKRSKKSYFDGSHFALIDIEMAKNTNMKNEEVSCVHSRKMTLKFIFVTPRQLIEKEGKEQKMTRVNMYLKSTQNKYDLLGQKEEFRVNSQFALGTGMIGDELSAESHLGQQSVSLCEESTILESTNFVCENVIENEPEPENEPDLLREPDFLPDLPPESPGELPEIPEPEPEIQSPRKNKTCEDFLNEPKAPLEESWEPLEPHEVVTISKPIRKGRRKRPQPNSSVDVSKVKKSFTKSRGASQSKDVQVVVPIEEFLITELKKGSKIVENSNIASSLQDEVSKIKASRKVLNKDSNENISEEKQVEENVNEHWEDFQDNDALDFLPEDENLDEIPTENLENVESNKDSYEELVMKRVADYVAQSQDYIQSTDLAKRVRIWHESLAPKLEEVEKRGDFDIHQYGSKILDKFPPDSRKTSLDFCQVIEKSSSQEEVARLFLSSLMLANAQNVEIECSAGKNEKLPMDQVSLTLLSTQRHHEHMLENIPETSEAINKKRKKKSRNLDVIQEEEFQETLDAFDAVPVAKKNNFAMPQKPTSKSKSGGRCKT